MEKQLKIHVIFYNTHSTLTFILLHFVFTTTL